MRQDFLPSDNSDEAQLLHSNYPALDQFTVWLSQTHLPLKRAAANQWTVTLEHKYCECEVSIVHRPSWYSFAAILLDELLPASDRSMVAFYHQLLQVSHDLYGVHIVIDNDGRLVLTRDEYSDDMDDVALVRSLSVFNRAHEELYREIYEEAIKYGIKSDDISRSR